MRISLLGLSQSFAQIDESNSSIPTINGIEWKTYSNGKLGFSVEYPSNWIVKEKSNRFEGRAVKLIKDEDCRNDQWLMELVN